MTLMDTIKNRHSVREYTDKKLETEIIASLEEEISRCNSDSGLHIQLAVDEPEAFGGLMAHYGNFRNVKNYLVIAGRQEPLLEEKAGYFGERLVLKAQQLGLNSCWVAVTYRKGKCRCQLEKGEKIVCVIALGYGKKQGVPHKSKPVSALCNPGPSAPPWFQKGMEAAALAPTAMNQQKFFFTLEEGKVLAKATGSFYSSIDLGIVKYHFECGAGADSFVWG